MPPKGYISLTIRKDIYEKLESLRINLGFSSISNLLVFLIDFYITNIDTRKEIGKFIEMLEKCVERIYTEPTKGE